MFIEMAAVMLLLKAVVLLPLGSVIVRCIICIVSVIVTANNHCYYLDGYIASIANTIIIAELNAQRRGLRLEKYFIGFQQSI
jgi:hypothetical protein